jgi:hypothetical protein
MQWIIHIHFLAREGTCRLRALRVIGRVGRDRALGFSGSSSICQRWHHIASRLQKMRPQSRPSMRIFTAGWHLRVEGTAVTRVAVERQNRILLDLPLDA